MKNFFNLTKPYKFELNDLRCFVTLLNVALIFIFGASVAWFGLIIAGVGIIKDLTVDRRLNGLLMHSANFLLNLYFVLDKLH